MKTFKPFDSTVQFCSASNFYTLGLEYEFWAESPYFSSVINKYEGILGVDGSGEPTGEYRSPVFKSTMPRVALNGCINFTTKVLDSLVNKFTVEFAPVKTSKIYSYEEVKDKLYPNQYCYNCNGWHTHDFGTIYQDNRHLKNPNFWPLGVHFSLGGKFLTDGNFVNIYNRAEEVQLQLKNIVEDLDLFNLRELEYKSKFNGGNSCNAVKIKSGREYTNLIEHPEQVQLVEFRFFPSCDYKYLWPYLRYIILGGNCPTHKLPSLRN